MARVSPFPKGMTGGPLPTRHFKTLFANSDLVPFLKQGRDPADGRIIFDLANDEALFPSIRGRKPRGSRWFASARTTCRWRGNLNDEEDGARYVGSALD